MSRTLLSCLNHLVVPCGSPWKAVAVLLAAGLGIAGGAAAQPGAHQSTDLCLAGHGADADQKALFCDEAIASRSLKGPALGLAFFNRGRARESRGGAEDAVSDYKQALSLFNEAVRSSAPSAPLIFQRGVIYQTLSDSTQALIDFSMAIRLAPDASYAYVGRGLLLSSSKFNDEGALADFDSALRINRCEIGAWLGRGSVNRKEGKLDTALKDYGSALECFGKDLVPVTDLQRTGVTANSFKLVDASTQAASIHYQRGLVYFDKAPRDPAHSKQWLAAAIADFERSIRLNPAVADPFIGRASARMSLGDHAAAIPDWTEAIRLSPGNASSYLNRGVAYDSANQPDNAIADYTEAHRLNAKDLHPLFYRGIVYYSKKGLYDQAIDDFTRALAIDPKKINVLINRGIAWREKGDPDRAIADFSEALRQGLVVGDVLKLESREPEAVRHWEQVAKARYQRGNAYVMKKEFDLALSDLNEAIRINPRDDRAWTMRGGLFLARGEAQRAINDFNEAIRLNPNDYYAVFQRGFAYHSIEEADKAFEDYSRSIALNEKYITAHLNRGIILYTRRGEFDAAIADFGAALQLGPDNVNALTHRGVAYGAKGDFRSAFADLDHAIAIAPEFDKARYYRALVHGLAGQPALALQDLDAVLRLDLANIDALTMRARVYGQLLDNEKAVRDYSAALKIAPDAAALHYNRGVSLIALKRTEEALADFNEAIRLNAGLAEAFNNRCLLRLARGDGAREAGMDCDRALRLQPSNPAFHEASALVCMKQGDYRCASRHFDEAFTADPGRALALYGRGFTKKLAGDSQFGERDMLAAESIDHQVRDAFGKSFLN